MTSRNKKQKGAFLLELMLAIAIFIVGFTAVSSLFTRSYIAINYSVDKNQAIFLAKQGIEQERSARDANFNNIVNKNTIGQISLGSKNFERTIETDCWLDSCDITSSVGWEFSGKSESVSLSEKLTDWKGDFNYSSLYFNGENSYVDCGNHESMFPTDSITVTAWVKGGGSSDSWRNAVSSRTGSSGFFIRHRLSSSSQLESRIYTGESGYGSNVLGFPENEWVFTALSYDKDGGSGNFKFYVNEAFASSTRSGEINNGDGNIIAIGAINASSPTQYFDGFISDVRIYNRALESTEISDLYNGVNITDGLVGHWPLGEGSGATANDVSGNNNNGSINNGIWVSDHPFSY